MGLDEMTLLGLGMGTMLANFHMCGIMLLLRAHEKCKKAYVY